MSGLIRVGKKDEMMNMFGWVMQIKPFYAVSGVRFGYKLVIKTVRKKRYDGEDISVYVSLVIRDEALRNKIEEKGLPLAVRFRAKKSGEKEYPNDRISELENTKNLCWVFVKRKNMEIEILDEVPDEIIELTGVNPPTMSFLEHGKKMKKLMS